MSYVLVLDDRSPVFGWNIVVRSQAKQLEMVLSHNGDVKTVLRSKAPWDTVMTDQREYGRVYSIAFRAMSKKVANCVTLFTSLMAYHATGKVRSARHTDKMTIFSLFEQLGSNDQLPVIIRFFFHLDVQTYMDEQFKGDSNYLEDVRALDDEIVREGDSLVMTSDVGQDHAKLKAKRSQGTKKGAKGAKTKSSEENRVTVASNVLAKLIDEAYLATTEQTALNGLSRRSIFSTSFISKDDDSGDYIIDRALLTFQFDDHNSMCFIELRKNTVNLWRNGTSMATTTNHTSVGIFSLEFVGATFDDELQDNYCRVTAKLVLVDPSTGAAEVSTHPPGSFDAFIDSSHVDVRAKVVIEIPYKYVSFMTNFANYFNSTLLHRNVTQSATEQQTTAILSSLI